MSYKSLFHAKYILLGVIAGAFLLAFASGAAYADSPPNINTDIPWSDSGAGYSTVNDIETAFNYARRQEEIQLGLAANTLGTLSLPSQSAWDAMSDNDKALFLINKERTDRANMQPGVIGLPLTGILPELDDLSQYYADFELANDKTGHNADGQSPFDRINRWPVIDGCHEFLARAENIAYFWQSSGTIPMPVERAVYNWIYVDSASSWGHREAVLLQDKTVDGHGSPYGYDNNAGGAATEGYLGIGVAIGGPHQGWNSAAIVVMNIIDPKASDCSNVDGKYDFSDARGYGFAYYDNSGPFFGTGRTVEDGPLPSDDNDGIARSSSVQWTPGGTGSVDVTIGNGPGYLTAWIDWNKDGAFADSERIINNVQVTDGAHTMTFSVPASPSCYGASSSCYARFRLSDHSEPDISPMGAGSPGEVNDHSWSFGPNALILQSQDTYSFSWKNILIALLLLIIVSLSTFYMARKQQLQR